MPYMNLTHFDGPPPPFFSGGFNPPPPPQGPIGTPPPRFPFGTPPSPPRPLGVPSQWGKKKFQSGLTPPASSSPAPSLGPLRGPSLPPRDPRGPLGGLSAHLGPSGRRASPSATPEVRFKKSNLRGVAFNEWRAFNGFLAYLWPKLNWLNKKKKKKQTISNLITFSIGRNLWRH